MSLPLFNGLAVERALSNRDLGNWIRTFQPPDTGRQRRPPESRNPSNDRTFCQWDASVEPRRGRARAVCFSGQHAIVRDLPTC